MDVRSFVGARWLVVVSAFILCGPAIGAQERGSGGVVIRGPADPGFRLNLESDIVKGAPYSADVINESTQALADGNRIVRRSTARVYRDAEGRVRREEARPSGPPAISITDPVAGVSWSLDAEHKVVRQTTMPPLAKFYDAVKVKAFELNDLASAVDKLTVFLNVNGQLRDGKLAPGDGVILLDDTREQRAEEKLPGRTIEGVWAEGVRRTTTIAAGVIGNERPITVVSVEWTSPDLQALVLTEHTDPRVGTSTYKVVNIVRSDPDPSLFQVPPDYTVQAGPGRGGRGVPPRPEPR